MKIYLDKQIPFPGGLGGGSSNAAIALLGLSKLWGLSIKFKRVSRNRCANWLGCAVFSFMGETALGIGRGTEGKGS